MLDTPGRGWLCTDLYFPNIICDPYVMSNNKARISLCAAARVPGPGKLAVEESEMLSQHVGGLSPGSPTAAAGRLLAALCALGHGVRGSSCQKLQWRLLGVQGGRNLGQNRVCFPSRDFSHQLGCGLVFPRLGGVASPRGMLLSSDGICGMEAKGPVSSLEPR